MSKSIQNPLTSVSNTKLLNLIRRDDSLVEELQDAKLLNNIALNLYKLRMDSGLTQKQLAEKLGVKQSNISRWESVGYQGYKVKILNRIVRALGGSLNISINGPLMLNFVMTMTKAVSETNLMSNPNGGFSLSNRSEITEIKVQMNANSSGASYATQ
jgi:transcriptional regulator with XRE-family HTH domain